MRRMEVRGCQTKTEYRLSKIPLENPVKALQYADDRQKTEANKIGFKRSAEFVVGPSIHSYSQAFELRRFF